MSTTLSAGTATTGAALASDTSGVLQLQSGSTPTTAVTIDTAQNVGVGVTPSTWSTGKAFEINNVGNSLWGIGPNDLLMGAGWYYNSGYKYAQSSQAVSKYELTSGTHIWSTAPSGSVGGTVTFTQAMTLDNSGHLLLNTASVSSNTYLQVAANLASQNCMVLQDTQSSTFGSGETYIVFYNASSASAGSIQHTATTTVNYNTSSDERLKTDNGIATDTSVIDNLKVHNFTWKQDGRADVGVFAQEAITVKPIAVCRGKDESLDANGYPVNPWGVDYSKFVPDLIVYCQQLKKQITDLQAEVTALKGAK